MNQKTISSGSNGRLARLGTHLLMSLASAGLLSLAQSPIDWGFLAVIALVPWLIASRRAGAIGAVLLGLVMGTVHGLTTAHWLFAAFEAQGAYGVRSILPAILTALWGKGLLFGAIGWVAERLRHRGPILQAGLLATLFGLGELWISESRWGLPLILLGHSQISVPGVAQLAVAVGVPGLSALLFATNSALASLFEKRARSGSLVAGLLAAWVASAILGIPLAVALRPPATSEPKTLLVVQPMISRAQRWDPAFQNVILDEIASHTSEALGEVVERPDLILWPENLLTTPFSRNERLRRQLQDYVDAWSVPLVTGLVRRAEGKESGQYRNSVVWWSPRIGLRDAIDKVRAIPLVESSRDFVGRRALAYVLGEASQGRRVAEANEAGPLVGEFTLSPVLCFEVLFPGIVDQRRDDESVAIVNLADDSWVPGEGVDRQLIAVASFRAIEQRLTLVRVTHGGLSVVVDPFGREIASLPPDQDSHMRVRVSAEARVSRIERFCLSALPLLVGFATWISGRRLARPGGPFGASRRPPHRVSASRPLCEATRKVLAPGLPRNTVLPIRQQRP